MRRPLIAIAALTFILMAGVYLTSPLWAAYKLRLAMKTGDTDTIERMVVWPSLRSSIKATITKNAKLLPLATQAARALRPTMWQRVRSVFGHSMLDRFIETYITPSGLPKLYRAKTRWHERFKRPRQPAMMQAGLAPDQLARVWRRIKRAEFKSPFRFILEIEDRHVATRLIESTFQLSNISLRGFDWKLSAVSIRSHAPAPASLTRLNGF